MTKFIIYNMLREILNLYESFPYNVIHIVDIKYQMPLK